MTAKKGHIIKKILFGLILFTMSLPALQHYFKFAYVVPLNGAIVKQPYTPFTWEKWFNGKFQDSNTVYVNDHFGFQAEFIRINNQKHYSLFNTAKAMDVVIGKDGYMYEGTYINAYLGTDFIGDDSISVKTQKLKFLQDTLASLGKDIFVVLAPGKGSFFPEYIPDIEHTKGIKNANYHGYVKAFNQQDIQYVDYHKWFDQIRDTSRYPLFPKCGIHWSKYGEYLVADSLIKKVEALRNVKLNSLILNSISVEEKNHYRDYDIGDGMNLLFRLDTYPMAYPQWEINEVDGPKPRVLFIADSYFWGINNMGLTERCFGNGAFWFYNNAIYPDSFTQLRYVHETNILEEATQFDVIVLLSTDANLHKFAFGFIDQMYAAFQE